MSIVQKIINKIAQKANHISDKYVNKTWHDFPMGKEVIANEAAYLAAFEEIKDKSYPGIDQFEQETNFSIDKSWLDALALPTQITIKKSELCYQHGRVLYSALRQYISQTGIDTVNILETGTARGFSAVLMAKALEEAGCCGKIITCDALPHNCQMYWNSITDTKGIKTRAEILSPYQDLINKYIIFIQGDTKIQLPKIQLPRIHFAYLDAMHTYQYVRFETQIICKKQQAGDIIVFDDYSKQDFPGVVKAVDEFCQKENYQKNTVEAMPKRTYVVATKL